MIKDSKAMEKAAVMQAAERICAAARTAPKTRGIDHLKTCVLFDSDIEMLAIEMERLSEVYHYDFFKRDAANIRRAHAVVLIGTAEAKRGLNDGCAYCHFKNCAECAEHGGACIYDAMDLGIALGSAVSIAADSRIDNRVMFSVGRSAASLQLLGTDIKVIIGIPLSVSEKSPFFDR